MLCIKNTKGLSKSELMKLNNLLTPGYDTSNILDTHNITELDTNNILYNDYIIYESSDNKISGLIGISANNTAKLAMINTLFVADMHTEAGTVLGKKLIGMVKMITKNSLLAIVKKTDSALIQYYRNLHFGFSELDIDYDAQSEVIMTAIE
jgi:hypothetical protein